MELAVVADEDDFFIEVGVVLGFGFDAEGLLAVVFVAVGFFGVGLGFAADVVFPVVVFLTVFGGSLFFGFVVWVNAGKSARPNSVTNAKNLIKHTSPFPK